jgi:hypothetical protein
MAFHRNAIKNDWFFKETHPILKACTIFICGDMFFVLPLFVLMAIALFFSVKFGLLLVGAYIMLRYFGEMIYWLLQQFSDRKYRPNDFGFKKLDNNAIYILYQTHALFGMMAGIALFIATLLFLH